MNIINHIFMLFTLSSRDYDLSLSYKMKKISSPDSTREIQLLNFREILVFATQTICMMTSCDQFVCFFCKFGQLLFKPQWQIYISVPQGYEIAADILVYLACLRTLKSRNLFCIPARFSKFSKYLSLLTSTAAHMHGLKFQSTSRCNI